MCNAAKARIRIGRLLHRSYSVALRPDIVSNRDPQLFKKNQVTENKKIRHIWPPGLGTESAQSKRKYRNCYSAIKTDFS